MADKKPEQKTASIMRRQLVENARNTWCFAIEDAHTIKDLLEPAYWQHVARNLRRGDHIEALADDGSWYAELLVVDAGPVYAKCVTLQEAKLEKYVPDSEQPLLAGHSVTWGGNHAKWRVKRDQDNFTLRDGFANKVDAYAWLRSYTMSQVKAA